MALHGEFKGYATIPDREQFNIEKDDDYVLALINSFGNTREAFLWGEDIEPVKVEASRMLSAPSQYERRIHYKRFIKELDKYIQNNGSLNGLDRLESLERLQGLERLERLQGLERLEVTKNDYRSVPLFADDVVYCDPPYKNTSDVCDESGGGSIIANLKIGYLKLRFLSISANTLAQGVALNSILPRNMLRHAKASSAHSKSILHSSIA